MGIKTIASLFMMLLVISSNAGVTYAITPSNQRSSSEQSLFVLMDNFGNFYGLYVYLLYGWPVLHGSFYSPGLGVLWPAYGFLHGDDMVLWVDNPSTGERYADSFAIAGEWNFTTMLFTGRWVSFNFPDKYLTGPAKMWLIGIMSAREGENNAGPLIGQSVVTHYYKDSRGFTWTLNLRHGVLYEGTVKDYQTWLAAGFKVGEEMFLWADAPEIPTAHDFIYIGKYCSTNQKYLGVWLDPEGPWADLVSWWSA
jgi:hypothetical protein